jgi:hypothetical protein
MYQIGVRFLGRISVFFRPPSPLGHPPTDRAVRRHPRIFFASKQLGPDARVTSVGIDEKNAPLARGGADQLAGRYLTQCRKGNNAN